MMKEDKVGKAEVDGATEAAGYLAQEVIGFKTELSLPLQLHL